MAVSSKKKIERWNYTAYSNACDEYQEAFVMGLAGSENGLRNIIKKMTARKAGLVLSSVGTFHIDDGQVSVAVSPTMYKYNTRLHSAVHKLTINVTVKGGDGLKTSKYGSGWSSREPETVFEVADNLADKVSETAWYYYNNAIRKLDEK